MGEIIVGGIPNAGDNLVSDPLICLENTATIEISNTESTVLYTLKLDLTDEIVGLPKLGFGGTVTFDVSPFVTTVYKVEANSIISQSCGTTVLPDKSIVTVISVEQNSVPFFAVDNVICSGEEVVFTLETAELNVTYQLLKNNEIVNRADH